MKFFTCSPRHSISSKKLFQENDIFYVMCKKIKFGAKIDVARDIFVILHKREKISVFHETCHVHIKCQDVHAKFLFMIF
jgi:hypothetical protein